MRPAIPTTPIHLPSRAFPGFAAQGSNSQTCPLSDQTNESLPALKSFNPVVFFLLILTALFATPFVSAQTGITWNGTTSTTWSTNSNWEGGTAPASITTTNYAIFSGSPTANQPNLTGARSIAGLDFQSAGWTLTNSTLTVGAFGIDSAGSGTNTVSSNVTVGVTGGTWTIGSGNILDLSGILALGAHTLTVNGSGTLRLSGTGANTANTNSNFIIESGATLEVNKTTPFANQRIVTVNGTVKWLQSSNTTNTAQFIVNAGGTLDLNGYNAGFAFSGAEKITLSGGTIQTGSGTWTMRGNDTTAATVNGTTVSTITGNVDFGSSTQVRQVKVFDSASGLDFNFSANITQGGTFTIIGNGTSV
jgi:hypothetical protein